MKKCKSSSSGSGSKIEQFRSSQKEATHVPTKNTPSNVSSLGHKQISVPIFSADVDENMVPIVKWLSSFDKTFTYCCCEGGISANGTEACESFCSFFCFDDKVLLSILTEVRKFQQFHLALDFHSIVTFPRVEVESYPFWSSGDHPIFAILHSFIPDGTPILRYHLYFRNSNQVIEFGKMLERNQHCDVASQGISQ